MCRRKATLNLHAWHDCECYSKPVVSHSIWGNKSIFCSCMKALTHLCTYSTGTEITLPYQYSIIHEFMIVFIWVTEQGHCLSDWNTVLTMVKIDQIIPSSCKGKKRWTIQTIASNNWILIIHIEIHDLKTSIVTKWFSL